MSTNWMHWCRLCACGDQDNIHENVFLEDKGHPLSETINKCFGININYADGWPNTICEQCFSFVKSILNLSHRVSKVQAMFSELIHGTDDLNANEVRDRYGLNTNVDVKFEPGRSISSTNIEEINVPEMPFEMKEQLIDIIQGQCMNSDEVFATAIKTEDAEDDGKSDQFCSYLSESDSRDTKKYVKRKKSKKFKSKLKKKPEIKRTPNYCSGCDKNFKTHSGYVRHMKREHDIVIAPIPPVLVCEICGKSYKTVGSLKEHKQTHSTEKILKCSQCDKAFNNQNSLRRHEDTHNGTNYICVVCGLQLNTKRTLQTHMIVHSEQKKYKCDLCGNEYKRAKALKYHLLTHTGLKPFLCDFCEKAFSTAVNCRIHLKRHHPVEFAQQEAAGKCQVSKAVVPELKVLKAELIKRHKTEIAS